ncbi:MAG TPA: hypothetical protein VK175_10255 [Leadbetterella sp.]|nr:hypothetical protein [Leadbetterella sp.]
MHLQNKVYLQELREQFLQKIVDEWSSKWQQNFGDFEHFEDIKNKNSFLEALLADIEACIYKKLNTESSKYLFSKDFLRRFIYEYGHKDARIQNHSRTGIALYLEYESWEDFLAKNQDLQNQKLHINYINVEESFLPSLRKTSIIHIDNEAYTEVKEVKTNKIKRKFFYISAAFFLLLICAFVVYDIWRNQSYTANELKDVRFEVIKTTGQYPQSVRIAYDVNTLSHVQRVDVELGVGKILAQDKYLSSFSSSNKRSDTLSQTYFYPGVYQLKLLVNKKVVKTINHVVYSKPNQWASWGFGVAYEKDWATSISTVKNYIQDGVLHFDPTELPREIKNENDFRHSVHVLTQNFKVNFDSLTIEYRMKNPENEGGESCYDMGLLFTDKNFNLGAADFTMIGCTDFAALSIGNTIFRRTRPFEGKMYDLDSFGVNQNEWNIFKIKLRGNLFEIFINGKSVFRNSFETNMPPEELADLRFTFKGAGSIDWVKVSNSYTGKIAYQTNFDE